MVTDGPTAELAQLTSSMTKPKFSFVILILQPMSVHSGKCPRAVIYTGPLAYDNHPCWFSLWSEGGLCRWRELTRWHSLLFRRPAPASGTRGGWPARSVETPTWRSISTLVENTRRTGGAEHEAKVSGNGGSN